MVVACNQFHIYIYIYMIQILEGIDYSDYHDVYMLHHTDYICSEYHIYPTGPSICLRIPSMAVDQKSFQVEYLDVL